MYILFLRSFVSFGHVVCRLYFLIRWIFVYLIYVFLIHQVLVVLAQAAQTRIDGNGPDDLEHRDYVNSLREAVLEAYTSIMYGLQEGKVLLDLFQPSVNAILTLVAGKTN
jgi:hypothetical protein